MTAPRVRSSSPLLAIALVLLVASLLGALYSVESLRTTEVWARHTGDVRLELSHLLGALADAETGQRGYLATGDARFLEPYTRGVAAWRGSFERVRALTADNPTQGARLAGLESLIGKKLAELERGIAARDAGLPGSALVPALAEGKSTMDAIRDVIGEDGTIRGRPRRGPPRPGRQPRADPLRAAVRCVRRALLLVIASAWTSRGRQLRADRTRVAELAAALKEATLYRLLVESANDAAFILDPTGVVTTWTPAAARIKGYSADEIVGKHFSTFYGPDDLAARKPEHLLETAAREGVVVDEGWRVRKDGSRFWASVTITAMRDESGQLVGFAKMTRDMTERMRDEERLRDMAAKNAALEARAQLEAQERVRRDFMARAGEALASSLDYRATLSTVAQLAVPELADWCSVELVEPGAKGPSQVALAHADAKKIEFARELARRYPPNPEATSGVPQVIRTGRSELYAEVPAQLLEAGARDAEHLRMLRELRLESAMVVPLRARGEVIGAITFIYAASGRRYTDADMGFAEDFARRAAMAIENAQAHASVSKALEFQERFVAVLGHDLRNPLAAIDMARGLLAQLAAKANDATALRILARIESSSRRMARMIEQILDLARTRTGGGLEVHPANVELCGMLTGIVNELRTAHPGRSIELECSPPVEGSWDRDRLEQVFSNLLGNAIHHGDAGGPVRIQAREEEGAVRVDVHNLGSPVPQELLPVLFSPFRRGDTASRTTKTAGLGLGLYISHEIVGRHGGKLEVQSNASEGTTFRVTLPRVTPAAPPE